MPKTITRRHQLAWTQIATRTFGLNIGDGMLVRHGTTHVDSVGESMAFVPGACIDDVAPWREVEVCADGDPDCGDPDCERKHASSESPPPSERFGAQQRADGNWYVNDLVRGTAVALADEVTAIAVRDMLHAVAEEAY